MAWRARWPDWVNLPLETVSKQPGTERGSGMSDEAQVIITAPVLDRLNVFLAEPKFADTPGKIWDGRSLVSIRLVGEPVVNDGVDDARSRHRSALG